MNIYVGNLPYATTEQELAELFGTYGEVINVSLITDRQTGRPRGFGFVEMSVSAEGQKAIDTLGGELFNGRHLTINEARNRQEDGDPAAGENRRDRPDHDQRDRSEESGGYTRETKGDGFGRIGGGYTNTLLNRGED